MSPSDTGPADRLGAGGCLIVVLGGFTAAALANGGMIYLLRSCHDTDAGTNFALGLSWVMVFPVLWLVASLLLSLVCFAATRWTPSPSARGGLVPLGAIVLIGPLIWWYWSFGVSGASTGIYALSCPGGAPAWWPSWLPLYSP